MLNKNLGSVSYFLKNPRRIRNVALLWDNIAKTKSCHLMSYWAWKILFNRIPYVVNMWITDLKIFLKNRMH
jgi:hypothetical protein